MDRIGLYFWFCNSMIALIIGISGIVYSTNVENQEALIISIIVTVFSFCSQVSSLFFLYKDSDSNIYERIPLNKETKMLSINIV